MGGVFLGDYWYLPPPLTFLKQFGQFPAVSSVESWSHKRGNPRSREHRRGDASPEQRAWCGEGAWCGRGRGVIGGVVWWGRGLRLGPAADRAHVSRTALRAAIGCGLRGQLFSGRQS